MNNDRFRRLSSGRLAIPAALYPDRGDKSRPCTLAMFYSDDDAATWQILGNIEDESHDHCYTSMLFFDKKLLLTYHESENSIKDGKPVRRALASLKMLLLDLETLC